MTDRKPSRLAALREMEAKATEGPWRHIGLEDGNIVVTGENGNVCELDRGTESEASAALICAARNALPALLECAAVLRELLTECPSKLDEATFPKRGINDGNRKQVVFNMSVSADRIKRGEDALRELEGE